MNAPQTFDVLVVGGGLVGASLALALELQGRHVALFEGQQMQSAELEAGWDTRIYAISPQNRRFLESLAAWPEMERITAVAQMAVRGDSGGRLNFSAAEIGAPALAWIAENRWLQAALWQRLHHSQVRVFDHAQLASLTTEGGIATVTMADGSQICAALVVGADGANSWVREQVGLEASIKDYGQSGVVANFACERPHGNCARQWFLGDGVLAWLPLPGNRISMVWSTFDPDRLISMDDATLAATVAAAGGGELGELTVLSAAAAFPLRLIRPEAVIAPRVALVGDAAHTVHPLAGQGVNLGFQDAEVLCRLLTQRRDPGEWQNLRRYQRSRREAVSSMQLACDGLFSLFHQQHLPGLARVRNAGLSLVNHFGPLKRQFARHAVGL